MTSTTNNGSTAEKIAKLLALAERTDNPAEAEAFTERAEAMMLKHGIELAMLHAAGETPAEKITLAHREYKGRSYGYQQMFLSARIAAALGLQMHYSELGRDSFKVTLCGYESDLQLACQLIDSLQLQCAAAMTTWWRAKSHQYGHLSAYSQRSERRSFMLGFAQTAETRVAKMYAREIAEAGGESSSTALALRDRRQEVASEYASRFPHLGRARSRQTQGGYSSRSAGKAAGSAADVGSRASSLNARRAIGQ